MRQNNYLVHKVITDDNAPELDGESSRIKAKHLGPDYVMTKTGHYELRDVCRWARESNAAVRAEERNSCLLRLFHHGWSQISDSRVFLLCWKTGLHDELNIPRQSTVIPGKVDSMGRREVWATSCFKMLPSCSSTERCLASSASADPPCAGSLSSSLSCVEYERVLFVCEPGNRTAVMSKFEKKAEGEGRGEWLEDAMKLAVAVVLEIQMSERAASKRYNVPRNSPKTKKEEARQARKQIRFVKERSAKMLPQSKKKEKTTTFVDYDKAKPCTSSTVDCIVCGTSYEENWIQCKTREGWAYELCAEIDDTLFYYCDYCKLNN
ncbi:hypothetical protein J6590_061948 [Homalodisca vitripennis]|nr:hypothetical protein J6590_061948 [Homalodisca vitripennis]